MLHMIFRFLLLGLDDDEIFEMLDGVYPNNSDIEIEDEDVEADIQAPAVSTGVLEEGASDDDDDDDDANDGTVSNGDVSARRDPTQRWRHKTEFLGPSHHAPFMAK
ncbi:uncharacterized protein [Anabrus simplex]|uniref:uncharacterized protein n=1 Tax=Anabrus simplex TaxID=316456 RepID=UPI0035A3697F